MASPPAMPDDPQNSPLTTIISRAIEELHSSLKDAPREAGEKIEYAMEALTFLGKRVSSLETSFLGWDRGEASLEAMLEDFLACRLSKQSGTEPVA